MLLTSSILTYFSTNSDHFQGDVTSTLQGRVARWFSIFLRRLGKVIAVLNAGWIVATGLFQFSNFYNRCYCDSNIMAVGRDAAYVIILSKKQSRTRSALGRSIVGCTSYLWSRLYTGHKSPYLGSFNSQLIVSPDSNIRKNVQHKIDKLSVTEPAPI
jgi:hypothetical protein